MKKNSKTLELNKILELLANQARCADAKEMALNLTPVSNLREAVEQMRLTSDAYSLSMRFGSPTLMPVKNIINAAKRGEIGAVLTTRELLDIAEMLRNVRALCQWKEYSKDEQTSLDDYFAALSPNKALENKITGAILSEEEISDNASPALADIRRKMKNCSQNARGHLDKMIKSPQYQKFLQENIITIRDSRFVVPVKAEYKNEIKGLVHDTSSSGATLFIEPIAVVELNNELRILQSKEAQEIERILAELSADVGTYCESICDSYRTLIVLDLYFAKANLGITMKGTVPEITDDGIIDLKKARHPLIEAKSVVPIDIYLGKDFDTLVITGPNTGGKTVSLKTIGLFTLMAMCGLMLPCADESKVSVFEQVLADIGDEQSIEQSLSTFSSHITNIISILKTANDRSLVLLDELCSGTDPVEGAALAISIIEKLRQLQTKVVATTHYSEIKMFALETEGVENACCEFDVATLRPTYKLLIGVPGRSNAFAISKRLGISDEIVDRAQQLVSNENLRFEDIVSSLEEARQNLAVETETARMNRILSEQTRKETEAEKNKLQKQQDRELERAREQARRIVEEAKRGAELLMQEIEEIRKQKNSEQFSEMAAQAKSQMKSKFSKLDALADPVTRKNTAPQKPSRKLRKGDTVMIVEIGQKGTITSDPNSAGIVTVQAGIINMKVPVSELQLIDDSNKRVTVQSKVLTGSVKSKLSNNFKTELDLRGMTGEEAIMELDKFIDDCLIASLMQITIIHGKGTGALRNAVQSYLRRHKHVRTFRLGVYGEGEAGVTIAELK